MCKRGKVGFDALRQRTSSQGATRINDQMTHITTMYMREGIIKHYEGKFKDD